MGSCRRCRRKATTISDVIGFCGHCIRSHFDELWPQVRSVHHRSRRAFGLPPDPPRSGEGIPCGLCLHRCVIPEGGRGFCGLRFVEQERLKGGRPHEGNLSYYYDPLPTNCVADFVCPGGSGSGYPRYALSRGPEYGRKNLAVFYHACSFNCLFCQNHRFRLYSKTPGRLHARELAAAVDEKTTCICFFGGDPTPQALHAVKTSRLALQRASGRILRICWETNGAAQEPFLSMMARLSLDSGGCIKFDLKAWDEGIHRALCGVSNKRTFANFESLSTWMEKRPVPPLLIASTLLVPGYVDEEEVSAISQFIAGLNPAIPYALLAFYPQFYLTDLPTTSRSHAERCREAALAAGLRTVRVGNLHLLGDEYD